MHKSDPPLSFGVFKPVGHTVIAFRSPDKVSAAMSALRDEGFADSDFVRFTPQEMVAQVDTELQTASPLAGFGHELTLIKVHRALAAEGCSFLVVYAPEDEQAERVAIIARAMQCVAAQHYGRFLIEDLTERSAGQPPNSDGLAQAVASDSAGTKRL